MKLNSAIFILFVFAIPFISADLIEPGFHGVIITNYITNINDFPEYSFISVGDISSSMCPFRTINETGKIEFYYKGCGVSVYAVKKENLNINKITEMNNNHIGFSEITAYLSSINAKEVLNDIKSYIQVPDINPETERTNYLSIDLQQVKTIPDNSTSVLDNTILKRNNFLIYIFLSASLIALVTIIFIVSKKLKRK